MKEDKIKEIKEFNLNYVDVDDMVCVTAFQKKMINSLLKLAETHEDVRIVAKNENGTIVVHLPKKYVTVRFGNKAAREKKELTEEQKAILSERMRKIQEARKEKANKEVR